MRKWESEKHKSCGACQQKVLRAMLPLTTLFWVQLTKWRGCGWSVVQLYYDEEMEPLHGMHGSMESELEVQRTIKRAELTAFLGLLKKVIGPINVHVDNKGIIDALWRGEIKCIDPTAGDADLWIKIWEELHRLVAREKSGGSGACQGVPHKEA